MHTEGRTGRAGSRYGAYHVEDVAESLGMHPKYARGLVLGKRSVVQGGKSPTYPSELGRASQPTKPGERRAKLFSHFYCRTREAKRASQLYWRDISIE